MALAGLTGLSGLSAIMGSIFTAVVSGFFVSSAGNDANAGTQASPWLTIGHAITATTAGAVINLRGGDTFAENVVASSGRTLQSYGTGQATVAPSSGNGIEFDNCGGASVDNIIVTGTTPTTQFTNGVWFHNSSGGTTRYSNISVTRVTASGFDCGIRADCDGTTLSGYDGVIFNNNIATGCSGAGIVTWSASTANAARYTACQMNNNLVYSIAGNSYEACTGLIPGFWGGGVCNLNIVHDIGASQSLGGAGPGGIVIVYSDSVVAQYNEVYKVSRSTQNQDGGGIGIDNFCSNCTVEYNYTHDNDAAGYGFYITVLTGNKICYNLTVNDGQYGFEGWSITAEGTSNPVQIFNNTIIRYVNNSGGFSAIRLVGVTSTGSVIANNNVLVSNSSGSTYMINQPSGLSATINGNNYSFIGGAGIQFLVGSTTYNGVSAYNTGTGFEANGTSDAPQFLSDPGASSVTWGNPSTLSTFIDYQLFSTDPLVGAALDIHTLYGVTIPATDFAGSSTASPFTVGSYNLAVNIVATPTFSPNGGSFSTTQTVTISTTTGGAALHYTTDGTTPTSASALYSSPISVSTSSTVKAIGILATYHDSLVGSASFSISSFDTDAQAFFTAAGITDATQKTAVNTFVLSLKSTGVWTAIPVTNSAIYPFVGGTSSTCSFNLRNPAAFQITWAGTVTYDATGITGDGTTGKGTTGIVTNNLGTTRAGGVCQRNALTSSNGELGSALGTFLLDTNFFGNTYANNFGASGGGHIAATQTSSIGFFIINRDTTSTCAVYQNGTSLGTGTTDGSQFSEAIAVLSGASAANLSFAFVSSAGLSSQNVTDLTSAVAALNTALSR